MHRRSAAHIRSLVSSVEPRHDRPVFQLLVDDHLVAEQVAMSPAEPVELVAFANEFDADRQMGIGRLRSVLADLAVVAEPIVRVLRDGIDDALWISSR